MRPSLGWRCFNAIRRYFEDRREPEYGTVQQLKALWALSSTGAKQLYGKAVPYWGSRRRRRAA